VTVVCRVTFCDATLHCPSCPVDFPAFTLFRLAKDRQQDNAPSGNDVISDALVGIAEVEAKLTEFAVKLLCVRFTEIHPFRAQQVDVELGLTELAVAEAFEPFPDFRFKLYLSPLTHSEDDIPIGRRSTTLERLKSSFLTADWPRTTETDALPGIVAHRKYASEGLLSAKTQAC
jgi:hypothetical protein